MTFFNLIQDEDGLSLALTFSDGTTHTAPQTHPNFKGLKKYVLYSLESGDPLDEDFLRQQLDVKLAIGTHLNYVSERVRVHDGVVYFDGDVLNNALTEHIVRLLNANDDGWRGFVAFLEKVYTNPSVESRDSLYAWINNRVQQGKITITSTGDFIAYKGTDVRDDGTPLSVRSGTALVNGQVVTGQIPNAVGSIIEMPRSEVDANRGVACSTGLHAGTWDYASWFSQGKILTVKINPRDVVSVPTDSTEQKLRVSRYEVLAEVTRAHTSATYTERPEADEADADDDGDFALHCEDCGTDEDVSERIVGGEVGIVCDECWEDWKGEMEDSRDSE